MKYIVILGDGMADWPIEELNNKTPLMVAKKPNMDFIARNGICGMLKTIPNNFEPSSDVANLYVLGYDVKKCYTGRAPIEAASIGISLDEDDIVFRCNFITEEKGILKDYSAGHITSDEGKDLINLLSEKLKVELTSINGKFYSGVSYRNILMCKANKVNPTNLICVPPHDIIGEKTQKNLISVKSKEGNSTNNDPETNVNFAKILNQMMQKSKEILEKSEINKNREKEGKNKANMIWLWGQGKRPKMKSFKEIYDLKGAIISAVDLIKGIGKLTGMDVVDVEGATGLWDTNYDENAKACINALKNHDFIYLHDEATDEASHIGDVNLKILCIEKLDIMIGKILKETEKMNDVDVKIAVLPDHPTPIKIKTHTNDLVPFAIYQKGKKFNIKVDGFDELSCKRGMYGKGIKNFMEILLKT